VHSFRAQLPHNPGHYLPGGLLHTKWPELSNIGAVHVQWSELPDYTGHDMLRTALSKFPASDVRGTGVSNHHRQYVSRTYVYSKRAKLPVAIPSNMYALRPDLPHASGPYMSGANMH